jgi:hypothetical protein
MSRIVFLVIILQLLIIGCNQSKEQDSDKNDNVLLAKEVIIAHDVDIVNQKNPEWVQSLNRDSLFKIIFEKIFSRKVSIYGPSSFFGDIKNKSPYSFEDIGDRMNWKDNNQDYSELKQLLFYEKWNFDSGKLQFSKDVKGWCPIRIYTRKNGSQDALLRKMIFFIYPEAKIRGKRIATSMFYEFPWNRDYPLFDKGFDKVAFLTFIIEGIKSGKIIAYDPIYLVDKSKRKFTSQELVKYIGGELNPGLINIHLNSILFEENWYFGENTLSIQKDVKSFAFVQEKYDPVSGESSKKILFFIFPKE